MKSQIWVLNPDYSFKNDRDRICMYTKKERSFDSTPDWIGFVHPSQAMILSIFTNLNPINENIKLLAEHLNVTYDKVYNVICDFMGNITPIFTSWNGIYIEFPKNVLIPLNPSSVKPVYDFSIEDLKCRSINLTPDRNHKSPHSVLWMLTNKCVTNCKYCYADRNTFCTPLSTNRILELIEEISLLKMGYVDIIGGEIFLRKDWDVILKQLVKHKISPTYISTKVPITTTLVNKLIDTGFNNTIQISLDSIKDSTLGFIINTKEGYVENVKQGVSLLEKGNFKIQINTVLTSYNSTIDEINVLYQYIKEIRNLTLWEIRVPEVSLYNATSFSEIKASKSALIELKNYVSNFIIPTAKIKIVFSSEALDEQFRMDGPKKECFSGGTCGILQNRMFILPDGKVSVCEQMYWHPDFIIGDLKNSTIEEVWNSKRAIELFNLSISLFRDCSICKKCLHFDNCNSNKRRCIVKVVKAYGLNNWDYPDPRCKFAPPFNNDLIY